MLVFISWSGSKSKALAESLKTWLGQVIQAVDPWLSADIEKGVRWNPELSEKLENSRIGIICLTRENLNSKWILFEAGALSKMRAAHVCTVLLDLCYADVEQPLSQFQHTMVNREEIRKLVETINNAVHREGEKGIRKEYFDDVFNTNWPQLEKKLADIRESKDAQDYVARPDRQVLEEILELLRNQNQRNVWVEERLLDLEKPSFIDKPLERWLLGEEIKQKRDSVMINFLNNLMPPQSKEASLGKMHLFIDYLTQVTALKALGEFWEHGNLKAKQEGILRYMSVDYKQGSDVLNKRIGTKNREGFLIITQYNAKIAIFDNKGHILEKYPAFYGARLKLPDGSKVRPGQELLEWDPYLLPILSDVTGIVAYGDIIDGVSIKTEEDEFTGLTNRIVIYGGKTLRPRIAIKSKKDRKNVLIPGVNIPARYLLPVGTYILVEKGDNVVPGDILGRIHI
ncbi:TIR domain-containing protein [bacterium]|nr:TIR domain-containing protein [bacterium]